jgi:hypothetical protein
MNLARIAEIYERLGKLSLDLPLDPAGMGADFLREQISLCRNYLNEAGFYLQEVLQETSYVRMNLNAKETQYRIRSSQLLTQDCSVKALPALADRTARIEVILADEKREIFCLEQELDSLAGVEKVITFRKRELDNTMSSIRLQRSLLKDQVMSGQSYGDESFRSRNASHDPVDGMGAAELDAIIAEAEREAELGSDDLQLNKRASFEMAVAAPPESADVKEAETVTDFDLDEIISAGGINGTFDEDVTLDAPPQPVGVPDMAEPMLSASDIDPEMELFLSARDDEFDDLLSTV